MKTNRRKKCLVAQYRIHRGRKELERREIRRKVVQARLALEMEGPESGTRKLGSRLVSTMMLLRGTEPRLSSYSHISGNLLLLPK